jgi:Uma2 family endonuclease
MKATDPRAIDPRVTFAELEQWPDEGRCERYELYDGEVIVVPSPVFKHQRVSQHVGDILTEYEKSRGGVVVYAPFDIVFDEYNVAQPDLVYFREERRHLLKEWEAACIPPDLAVEVLSRKTEARDRGRKMDMFARCGVAEYWIVDPARNTIEVYVLRGSAYELTTVVGDDSEITSPTLPDLVFSTRRVFAE